MLFSNDERDGDGRDGGEVTGTSESKNVRVTTCDGVSTGAGIWVLGPRSHPLLDSIFEGLVSPGFIKAPLEAFLHFLQHWELRSETLHVLRFC